MTDTPLVIGVDAGGTRVRALVASRSGRRLGTGRAAGANPVTRGLDEATARIGEAVRAALSDLDPSDVGAAAVGWAGQGAFPTGEVAAALDSMRLACGLTQSWVVRSDVEVAFAAASPELDGLVVLSGTGATVGEIRGGRMVRYVDGAGWLVGDVGSGFWLGLRAVRAAIADREGRGEPSVLTAGVSEDLGVALPAERPRPGTDPGVVALVSAIYRREPRELAELAPLVSRAAEAGDPVATRLVERAVTALLDDVAVLRRDAADLRQVALAGGVLLAAGPLREAVRNGLVDRWGLTVDDARDGAAGAAWCARRQLDDEPSTAVHARLTASGV